MNSMIGARALAPRAPYAFGPRIARMLFLGAGFVALLHAGPAWSAWQTFGSVDGLVSLQVTAIAQDSSENLWFSTPFGASRYDGASFRTFGLADGLPAQAVREILPDREGRIWFATPSGAAVDDHGTWTTLTTDDGLVSDLVSTILEDRSGRLWFGTDNQGVSRFDGSSWTTFQQTDGLAGNEISCLYEDQDGNIWVGTQFGGVSLFDGVAWTTYTAQNTSGGLASNAIRCIVQTRDGAMWIGTAFGGVSRFAGGTWTTFTTAGAIPILDARAVKEDASGRVWVGSAAGVGRYDGRAWRSYTTADGLPDNSITALSIDRNGNVWIATTQNGVARYDGESWKTYTDDAFGVYGAQSILEDRAGEIWAATPGGGIEHFDRASWTNITSASTSGGLAGDNVAAIAEDSTGALWFGTTAGASRYAGGVWQAFTTADGMAGNNVAALARDSSGAMWLGTTLGLSRFDGSAWTSYTTANGLPANRVRSLLVDHAGRVWCGTTAGVSVLDGGNWTTYTTSDGLAGASVYAILQDHQGAMWFGTPTGLSRFDAGTWRTYTLTDGLAAAWVLSLAEGPDSVLWVGTFGGGVSRFDGAFWHTYSSQDGLPSGVINGARAERSGSIWFASTGGATIHDPARVPPQTVITVPAPVLSANRLQTIHFAAAYRQIVGIEFATSLDAGPWSPWGTEDTWIGRDLPDGVHTLRVAARDALHHVDPTPASSTFEIAATPPVPVITAPVYLQAVRDTMLITGTAQALRFKSLSVELRPAGAPSWNPPDATVLAQSTSPVVDGPLTSLATRPLADGNYELRLAVSDTLGLTGYTQVTFIVDNVAPFAAQTTPALVSALSGGDVFTTNREAHVYIPPRCFPRDATVHIDPLDPSRAPAALPDGANRVTPGFAVGTGGVPVHKTATLDLAVPGTTVPAGQRLAIYAAGSNNVWQRLGGTLDANGARISTPITATGEYAIYLAPANAEVAAPLQLSLTPRILSSRGGLAGSSIQIGFELARAATVRVTIHNRAGRLVRIVTSGAPLGPGTNLLTWDGRDEDHHDVDSGLYLVTVEALGETLTKPLAVVR